MLVKLDDDVWVNPDHITAISWVGPPWFESAPDDDREWCFVNVVSGPTLPVPGSTSEVAEFIRAKSMSLLFGGRTHE